MPETGVTRLRVVSSTTSESITPPSLLLRTHAPHHNPLAALGLHPIQRVFAGCDEPLLEGGGSRRYLHNPCMGAWVRTPPRLPGACTRFFPGNFGLTHGKKRSARGKIPAMRFPQGITFRGCNHSFMFRLPCSLGPQVAPTAGIGLLTNPGQPGRLHHAMDERSPARTVASLRA